MTFRYAPEFTEDLKRIVAKPGVRIFLAEALAELDREVCSREERFLAQLRVGASVIVGLESKGKAQIVRGEDREGRPRYLTRFLGAPHFVLVATREAEARAEEPQACAQGRKLAFTAIVELGEEIAKNSPSQREAPTPSRM
jgi:hypothetical protein